MGSDSSKYADTTDPLVVSIQGDGTTVPAPPRNAVVPGAYGTDAFGEVLHTIHSAYKDATPCLTQ